MTTPTATPTVAYYCVLIARAAVAGDFAVVQAIDAALAEVETEYLSPGADERVAFVTVTATQWAELRGVMKYLANQQFPSRLMWLLSPPLPSNPAVWSGWITEPRKWEGINAITRGASTS